MHIKSKKIDDVINRQSLIKLSPSNEMTIDSYRLAFTNAGYLAKTDKLGEYKVKNIPESCLTVSALSRQAKIAVSKK
jgi:hypothetical protein